MHPDPPAVGDHLAMDLLNTEARVDGEDVDYWRDGGDVLAWLARHGIAASAADIDRDELLAQARALRALARRLVVQRKEDGSAGDIGALNAWLHAHVGAPHLERDGAGNWTLLRRASGTPVAALLGPLAEAVAQLLVDGQFELVRQCEHPDCVLWFYDRTKAHKRRWCSMALCGNRHKAAQFRKRGGAGAA
nr:ABATE domain-containing protein [uncultured Massilia sp.]